MRPWVMLSPKASTATFEVLGGMTTLTPNEQVEGDSVVAVVRQVTGVVPLTVEFRDGESESFGVIEKVTYEVRGNDVIVHSESGMGKGMAVRYTMTGPDSATAEFGTLRRIQ